MASSSALAHGSAGAASSAVDSTAVAASAVMVSAVAVSRVVRALAAVSAARRLAASRVAAFAAADFTEEVDSTAEADSTAVAAAIGNTDSRTSSQFLAIRASGTIPPALVFLNFFSCDHPSKSTLKRPFRLLFAFRFNERNHQNQYNHTYDVRQEYQPAKVVPVAQHSLGKRTRSKAKRHQHYNGISQQFFAAAHRRGDSVFFFNFWTRTYIDS
jgi:hypothetical protein